VQVTLLYQCNELSPPFQARKILSRCRINTEKPRQLARVASVFGMSNLFCETLRRRKRSLVHRDIHGEDSSNPRDRVRRRIRLSERREDEDARQAGCLAMVLHLTQKHVALTHDHKLKNQSIDLYSLFPITPSEMLLLLLRNGVVSCASLPNKMLSNEKHTRYTRTSIHMLKKKFAARARPLDILQLK